MSILHLEMFKYHFAILCLALLSANEGYGSSFFCSNRVVYSLVNCLFKTDITPHLEVHGLSVDKFNQRLECARQAKCNPKLSDIFDKKILLVREFAECMEEISSRPLAVYVPIYLHEVELQCREKLANGLPDDLKHYFPFILGYTVKKK